MYAILAASLLASLARGEEGSAAPTDDAVAPPPWSEPGEELVVQAEGAVTAARAAIEAALHERGYGSGRDRRGRTVFARPRFWKTKVVLYDDGLVDLRTPRILPIFPELAFQRDPETGATSGFYAEGHFLATGPRAARAMQSQVWAAMEPHLPAWRDAVADRALAQRRGVLREQITTAWYDGRTPEGAALPTPAARRAWLLEAWLHTADNAAGAAVRADVEVFLAEVVQRSPHPCTAQELEAVNARRGFPTPLGLPVPEQR